MKKAFVLIIFSLFIVVGNVAAFDFNCKWEGYISCSNDFADDPPMYFKGEIIGKTIHITNYMRSDNSTCKGSATLIR